MDELSVLQTVIKNAGKDAMRYYGRDTEIRYKESDHSPVTRADFASQEILLKGLAVFHYAVLSEERTDSEERLHTDRVWIIDPLDGTSSFIDQTGEFSVMVALVEQGRPILGAIYQPVQDLLYWAIKGQGAFRREGNGRATRICVSREKDPRRARMLFSRHHLLPLEMSVGRALQVATTVQCGSAGVKAGRIAEGKAELYVTAGTNTGEWDTCAADILAHEAGGIMTDMKGELLRYNKAIPRNRHGFVVTNGFLHSQVIQAIAASSD